MSDLNTTIALNRSELTYLALEGLAGSLGQIYTLRFREPHSVEELKEACRYLVRIYPRLRALIERGRVGHHLRVLEDGMRVDGLFELAFRAEHDVATDRQSLERYLTELASEPFELATELPIRVRVLSSGPTPYIVFLVQHVTCDGRGMAHMLDSFMAYLNGKTREELPIDDPTMIPAVIPESPKEAIKSLARSFALHRREREELAKLVPVEITSPKPHFSPIAVRLHDFQYDLSTIKRVAKAHECTVTELQIALFTAASAEAKGIVEDGRNTMMIRISLDLRPYFPEGKKPVYGNFVAPFILRLSNWTDLAATTRDVRAQTREFLGRFERKEMSYPLLVAEIAPHVLPKDTLARAARVLKRKGKLNAVPVSIHISTIGSVDSLNQHGDRAHLDSFHGFVPAPIPFVGSLGIAGKLCVTFCFPRDDLSNEMATRVLANVDRALARLVDAIDGAKNAHA